MEIIGSCAVASRLVVAVLVVRIIRRLENIVLSVKATWSPVRELIGTASIPIRTTCRIFITRAPRPACGIRSCGFVLGCARVRLTRRPHPGRVLLDTAVIVGNGRTRMGMSSIRRKTNPIRVGKPTRRPARTHRMRNIMHVRRVCNG